MAELIDQLRSSRFVPLLALGAALAILAAITGLGAAHLRQSLHARLVNHDGEVLHAVAMARQSVRDDPAGLSERLQRPAGQLALALELSQLRENVLGVRLYDARGVFITAFPAYVSEAPLAAAAGAELDALRPFSRFHQRALLSDIVMGSDPEAPVSERVSLLEVNIPLSARDGRGLLATAQLLLDARDLEEEFQRVDRHLKAQAGLAFLAGGGMLTAMLAWAYRRLARSNALLRERTERLLRANHELTLAAKTGALGAVTAHLVHGLSNPLANVLDFVASRQGADDEWRDAVAATHRMRALIHEVVRVLGEESAADGYELTLAELLAVLQSKAGPAATEAGARLETRIEGRGQLANRHANLVLLILENLVHNAVQASPKGGAVRVSAAVGDEIRFEVADAGAGFPEIVLPNLFSPCRSTRGGCGLGLAISKQLASHLGARLELQSTGPHGSVMALALPRSILCGQGAPALPGVNPEPASARQPREALS